MKEIKSVGIIGRGAIGSLYGSLLKQNQFSSYCFIVDAMRKEKYEHTPFSINGESIAFPYLETGHSLDLIMITTKFSGLTSALRQIRPFMGDKTILLSCLNGISSESICREIYPHDQVIRCIVQGMDATYLQNEMHYTKVGEILFGAENDAQLDAVHALEKFFSSQHIPYRICKDILREQWNKLMLNCGINQVCARYACGYGPCQSHGEHQQEFIRAMEEVKIVANTQGISLTQEDIEQWIQLVDSLAADSMPSMAQDILAKRKTELALFSGTILPLARQLNLAVPTLQTLYEEIRKREEQF